ncbi:hypothetical protein ACQP25_17105 [Microtetraspora malaysiensis]|uniref:hypothetical protein n=1 Tax=Microtetraspora malaysiensis TaxID=161358 RepID=UPI003D936406
MPRSRSNVLDKAAWLHDCGEINLGTWADRAVCGGCGYAVSRAEDAEQYRLVRIW